MFGNVVCPLCGGVLFVTMFARANVVVFVVVSVAVVMVLIKSENMCFCVNSLGASSHGGRTEMMCTAFAIMCVARGDASVTVS